MVILANLSGFDGSPESLRKLQLEYGAEIARAVVKFQGPILFTKLQSFHVGERWALPCSCPKTINILILGST